MWFCYFAFVVSTLMSITVAASIPGTTSPSTPAKLGTIIRLSTMPRHPVVSPWAYQTCQINPASLCEYCVIPTSPLNLRIMFNTISSKNLNCFVSQQLIQGGVMPIDDEVHAMSEHCIEGTYEMKDSAATAVERLCERKLNTIARAQVSGCLQAFYARAFEYSTAVGRRVGNLFQLVRREGILYTPHTPDIQPCRESRFAPSREMIDDCKNMPAGAVAGLGCERTTNPEAIEQLFSAAASNQFHRNVTMLANTIILDTEDHDHCRYVVSNPSLSARTAVREMCTSPVRSLIFLNTNLMDMLLTDDECEKEFYSRAAEYLRMNEILPDVLFTCAMPRVTEYHTEITSVPTVTSTPSTRPISPVPTSKPSTTRPTSEPSAVAVITPKPSNLPTRKPTNVATSEPSNFPTRKPSTVSTRKPTPAPSKASIPILITATPTTKTPSLTPSTAPSRLPTIRATRPTTHTRTPTTTAAPTFSLTISVTPTLPPTSEPTTHEENGDGGMSGPDGEGRPDSDHHSNDIGPTLTSGLIVGLTLITCLFILGTIMWIRQRGGRSSGETLGSRFQRSYMTSPDPFATAGQGVMPPLPATSGESMSMLGTLGREYSTMEDTY